MASKRRRLEPARLVLGAIAVGLVVSLSGCPGSGTTPYGQDTPNGEDGEDGQNGQAVSFSAQVQSIFTARCAGCHSPGGAADLAGITLQLTEGVSYDLLVNQPSVQQPDLSLVVPGDSSSSLLYLKVSSDSPPVGERMPRSQPALSSSNIALIQAWIDEGAQNN